MLMVLVALYVVCIDFIFWSVIDMHATHAYLHTGSLLVSRREWFEGVRGVYVCTYHECRHVYLFPFCAACVDKHSCTIHTCACTATMITTSSTPHIKLACNREGLHPIPSRGERQSSPCPVDSRYACARETVAKRTTSNALSHTKAHPHTCRAKTSVRLRACGQSSKPTCEAKRPIR